MIYEIRTYGLVPGSLGEVEKRFSEAYESRKKLSQMIGFWHTDIGPLNEIIHIWPYKDLAERTRIRAEAVKDPNWPPKTQEFFRRMHSEILVPFPFAPEPKPGKLGPVYEMRIYTIKPGMLGEVMKTWELNLPGRLKHSPLILAGTVDVGEVTRFIHIWAYTSLAQRNDVRENTRKLGIWPPKGAAGPLMTMENKIMLPSSFSLLQ